MDSILEARLTEDFIKSEILSGRIHSKFRTVINVLFQMPEGSHRLITVLKPNVTGVPDSLTVTEETFSKLALLPIGSGILYKDFRFYLTSDGKGLDVTADCFRHSWLMLPDVPAKPSSLFNFVNFACHLENYQRNNDDSIDGFSTLTTAKKREIETNLRGFSNAWINHNYMKMESILMQYTGIGIGLTPSSDDAFIGIIAVFGGAMKYIELPDIGNITPFHKLLSNRTTDVSIKYLSCAREGRFSNSIIGLIGVMFSDSEESLLPYLEEMSSVGGSSGNDTLYGMTIACQELNKIDR